MNQNVLWLEIKYANILSNRLPLCSTKSKNGRFALHFRCVKCGDSKTDKYKKRGWIYEKNNHLYYGCFNCQHKAHFTYFLKEFDPELYKEYRLECFRENIISTKKEDRPTFEHKIEKFDKKRIQKYDVFKNIKKISQLKANHPAKLYVQNRMIPENQHYRLYYVDKFFKWVNTVVPDTFDEDTLKFDEPRLIFPLIDPSGYVFGFQGRSFNPKSKTRYLTIMIDDTKPKIFGLENIDFDKRIFAVEGPIDSLFLPNSIAMAGASADFERIVKRLNTIIVFDNQPRNPELVSQIAKYINDGWKVCLWPDTLPKTSEDGKPVKDINEMVQHLGLTPEEVKDIILSNSYSGLQAKLEFAKWSKV